jgi:uncharacterized protein
VSAILAALYRGDAEGAQRAADGHELDVFEAAALGRAERVGELVEADAELARAWTEDGFTALHLAAFFSGDIESARRLLEHGADPTAPARNDMQVTPLHSAAARGHGDIVELLLGRGADADAAQAGGYTALHSAAALGDRPLTDLLLKQGADRSRRSADGKTPGDLAAESGHAELADYLKG